MNRSAPSQVQQAVHCTTGARVALKQVYIKQPARGPSGQTHPAESAMREITALQTLKHSNVVSLLEVIARVCCSFIFAPPIHKAKLLLMLGCAVDD